MASIEEIIEERLKKLKILKERGISAYPSKAKRDYSLKDVRAKCTSIEEKKKDISIAGRVMAIRGQGAILFAVDLPHE